MAHLGSDFVGRGQTRGTRDVWRTEAATAEALGLNGRQRIGLMGFLEKGSQTVPHPTLQL